jgi:hypothetical protein
MNINNMDQSFAFYDKENKDVYFFYPPYNADESFNCIIVSISDQFPTLWPMRYKDQITTGGRTLINLSKTIDQLEGSIGELAGTIDSFGASRPALIVVNELGDAKVFEGYKDSGTPIDSRLQTGLYDMGSITQYKTIKEIDHLIHAAGGQEMTIDLIKSDFGREEVRDSSQTISLGRGSPKLSRHRATGRLFALKFHGSTDGYVEWLGSEAAVALRGLR